MAANISIWGIHQFTCFPSREDGSRAGCRKIVLVSKLDDRQKARTNETVSVQSVRSLVLPVKRPTHYWVKPSDFTVWHHNWRKNQVNCAVLTDNSAGIRTVLSSRLSHRELRSSLRDSHSFLSLPAHTTMASSQGTSVSSNSFSRWASLDILLFKYHFLLHILHLLLFSDSVMADVAIKRQPCFYPP